MRLKILVFLFIIILLVLITYLLFGKTSMKSNQSHAISFDVLSCFACYGCGCSYTVDHKNIYNLNEFDKTKCIYDLDNGQAGKYHDLIGNASKFADEKREHNVEISLKGNDFKKFSDCVKKYSK
jgi:Trk-type K+ transport system membrane component